VYSISVKSRDGVTEVYYDGRLDHIIHHGTGRIFR
jgi:hypothetical protein